MIFLMSYVGSIGILKAGTGIKEIIKKALDGCLRCYQRRSIHKILEH